MNFWEQQPEASEEAECGVVGSVMTKPDLLDDVSLLVSAADFTNEQYAAIYAIILDMHNANAKIDLTTVSARIKKKYPQRIKSKLDGGMNSEDIRDAVIKAMQQTPTSYHGPHYAKIVRDFAIKRELFFNGGEIAQHALERSAEAETILTAAEESILRIRDKHGAASVVVHTAAEMLGDAMAVIDKRMRGEAKPGIVTGFRDIDEMVGFRPELIIIAARPTVGKTALVLNLASGAAVAGTPTIVFSLEMSELEMTERLLASYSGVGADALKSGVMSPTERQTLIQKASELSQLPLCITDAPMLSIHEIASLCRRQKRKYGLGLVAIDYLQLIRADNHRDPRQEQVARISARLKALVKELKVPIICLAQLNRQSEAAKDNRPRLSHLRESGAIEQDADVVMFVHRPEFYARSEQELEDTRNKVELIVEKNRNGRRGIVNLIWDGNTLTFRPAITHSQNYDEYQFNGRDDF
jgi:replicative DNA helicase